MKTQRIKLTNLQFFSHFEPVWFLILLLLIFTINLFFESSTSGVFLKEFKKLLFTLYFPILLVTFLIAFLQYRRLSFKVFKVEFSEDQFKEALKRTTAELKWKVTLNRKGKVVAIRNGFWSGSWGEMISIEKESGFIYINSISDPNRALSLFSYGWNSRNINTFIKNLSNVINGIPFVPKIEPVINEWSLKNTLFRIVVWPFCLFLIGFGTFLILQNSGFQSFLLGLVSSLVGVGYIYIDIKMLTKR